MNNVMIWLLAMTCSLSSLAQVSEKKQAKAASYVHEAMLATQNFDPELAVSMFRKALKFDPESANALFGLATQLQRIGGDPQEQKALLLKLASQPLQRGHLSTLNTLSNLYAQEVKFDSALYYLNEYTSKQKIHPSKAGEIEQRKKSYTYAAKAVKKPINISPKALPNSINTEGSLHYFPSITADNTQLLFTQRRKGGQNEDVFISYFTEEGWQKGISLSSKINSHESEGTAVISADGRTLLFSYCGNNRQSLGSCDIYESKKQGEDWSAPVNLGPGINTKHWESQPAISSDGNTLYFISDRPGGIGGTDIYVAQRNKNGTWGKATILSDQVNTTSNESSPFIHANGISLFFASKGHVGFGGYDLFMTEKGETGQWGNPKNLGYPLNDPESQLSLFVSADGSTGYYSEEERDPSGVQAVASKIYSFGIPPEIKLGHRSNYVKGIVYDSLTTQPVGATLEIIKLSNNEVLYSGSSDGKNGSYMALLNEGDLYGLFVQKKGYFHFSKAFEYDEAEHFEPVELNIPLLPIKKGVTVVLNNIYFDFNKATLQPTSFAELDKLVTLLRENPEIAIEISGHTDNVGKASYNLKLSEERAKAVVQYLLSKGIAKSKLTAKGYGLAKPIASNETDAGREKNRRVEFEIK